MSTETVVEEVVGDVLDVVEDIPTVVRTNKFVVGGALFVGVAVGAAGAYLITKKLLKKKFDNELFEQVQAAKEHYAAIYKTGENGDLGTLASKYVLTQDEQDAIDAANEEALTEEQLEEDVVESAIVAARDISEKAGYVNYNTPVPQVGTPGRVIENVFDTSPNVGKAGKFDQDEEDARANADEPYFLLSEVFYDREETEEVENLVWYTLDNTLATEADVIIPPGEERALIGDRGLPWGYGTSNLDENMLYVANPTRRVLYQINRVIGSYTEMTGLDGG